MLRRTPRLEAFERAELARASAGYAVNLRIFEDMCEHARALGRMPSGSELDGIEVDIRLARILNALQAPREDREQPR